MELVSHVRVRPAQNGYTYTCIVDNEYIELYRVHNLWFNKSDTIIVPDIVFTAKYN